MEASELQSAVPVAEMCPLCHLAVRPEYFFCPNCGTNLRPAPLPTSSEAQLKLYAFSVILPLICFVFVSKWRGIAYLRSPDERTRSIGYIATFLLVLSTVVTIWYAVVWTQSEIQQSVSDVNSEMSF